MLLVLLLLNLPIGEYTSYSVEAGKVVIELIIVQMIFMLGVRKSVERRQKKRGLVNQKPVSIQYRWKMSKLLYFQDHGQIGRSWRSGGGILTGKIVGGSIGGVPLLKIDPCLMWVGFLLVLLPCSVWNSI